MLTLHFLQSSLASRPLLATLVKFARSFLLSGLERADNSLKVLPHPEVFAF